MKRIIYILLVIVLLTGCQTSKSSITKSIFEDDLNQLVDIIKDKNLIICDENTLENSKKEALLKIKDTMSERDFYLALLPIVNCGRVNLAYPEETMERFQSEALYIPIKVQTSNDKVYLVEDKTGTISKGLEIVSINNYSIKEIMEMIHMAMPLKGVDPKFIQPQIDMNFSPNLIFILESPEYKITLNDNGQLKEYIVPGITPSELKAWLFPVVEDDKSAYPDGTFVAKDRSKKVTLKNTGFVVKWYKDIQFGN